MLRKELFLCLDSHPHPKVSLTCVPPLARWKRIDRKKLVTDPAKADAVAVRHSGEFRGIHDFQIVWIATTRLLDLGIRIAVFGSKVGVFRGR
jgi:hypothetical protein